MPDAPFACPDLTVRSPDELGPEVVGQRLEPDRAVLECGVVEPDGWCRRCGCEGTPRDTVVRRLAHEPLGWRPTTLEVTVRRYRCTGCGHVWRQDTSLAAEPRAKLSRRGLRWALEISQCRRAVDVAMTILGGPQVEPCSPRSPPPVQASRFPQTVPRTNRLPSTYGPRRFTGLHARDRPASHPHAGRARKLVDCRWWRRSD